MLQINVRNKYSIFYIWNKKESTDLIIKIIHWCVFKIEVYTSMRKYTLHVSQPPSDRKWKHS